MISIFRFAFSSYRDNVPVSIILIIFLTEAGLLYAELISLSFNNSQVNFEPAPLDSTVAESAIKHLIPKFLKPIWIPLRLSVNFK